MIALIAFLFAAVAAGGIVAFLRQREGREQFKGQTFARRTAGSLFIAFAFAAIVILSLIAWFVISFVTNLGGCFNC